MHPGRSPSPRAGHVPRHSVRPQVKNASDSPPASDSHFVDQHTRSRRVRAVVLSAAMCSVVLCPSPLLAQTRPAGLSIGELKKLSIGQLSEVEVSSVSKTEETLGSAAAAVAVLTSEDIRRSGAT